MPPAGPLQSKQIAAIKTWIDQGADWPDALSGDRDAAPPDPGVVKIASALRHDNPQEFQRTLAENPKSVNAKGQSGWTPIMYAALYGDDEATMRDSLSFATTASGFMPATSKQLIPDEHVGSIGVWRVTLGIDARPALH